MTFNAVPRSSHLTLQQLLYYDKFLFTKSDPLQSPSASGKSRFLEEFDQIELLSKGAFGHVYKAKKKMENKKYAVKCIKLDKNHEEMAQDSTREVRVLSDIKHRNIVFYYNAWYEKYPPPLGHHDDGTNDENGDCSSESDYNSFDPKRLEEAQERYENVTRRSNDLTSSSQRQGSSDTDSDVSHRTGMNDQIPQQERPPISSYQSTESSLQPSENYTYLYIQMELCQQENLANWLKTRQPSNLEVDQIFREILSAVNYLHSKGLVHRDLKPNNILFDSDWSIKVGDFGLSKNIATDGGCQSVNLSTEEKKSNTFDTRMNHTIYVGTKPYMAPEQENSQTYDHKVDVYALAIILFELKMGPFKTASERVNSIAQLKSFQLSQDFKCSIKLLLYSMLSIEPDKRPKVEDILLEHFPKKVKQLNDRPIKPPNALGSSRAPLRHARDIFHSKLLMFFLNRGIRQGYEFHMGAKMPSLGGQFGDLVFKYHVNSSAGKNGSWRYLLVQANYDQEGTFKITAKQLLSTNSGDFNLAKHFRSYLDIRERGDDIHNCIICTNVGFDKEDLSKNDLLLVVVNPSNTIPTFENPPSSGQKAACYLLQITDHLRTKFTKDWSDIPLLAKTLLNYAKTYDFYALRIDVLKRNHRALVNERVIDFKTKKFHLDFVNNVNLSPGALQLRQIVCKLIGNEQILSKWDFNLGPNFGKGSKNAVHVLPPMVKDEDIVEFFNKLIFAVDMPNIADLDQILTDEIGQHFKLLGAHMLQKIWKLSHRNFLSSEDGLKILEESKQTMVLNNLNAISVDYRDRLRQFHCQDEPGNFKQLNKELEPFLHKSSENNIRVLRLTTTSPKRTAVKVFSALETRQEEEGTYLTVSSKGLEGPENMEKWKNALEVGPHQLLIVVCKDNVQFHEIYDKLILRGTLKKKVIIIYKNHESLELKNGQSNLQIPVDGWMEIKDHLWPSELQCIHVHVEETNPETFRNIFKLLAEPCTTEIAVLFVQGKMNENISCFQEMVPKKYDVIRNQSVPLDNKGFSAIVVHRSLVYQSILPSRILLNPQHIAGIQLSFYNSLLTLYSVYHDAKDIDLFFSEALTTCANSVLCTIPLASHAGHRDYEHTPLVSLKGDGITHGVDVHIKNVERLISKCGNQYVRFSVF